MTYKYALATCCLFLLVGMGLAFGQEGVAPDTKKVVEGNNQFALELYGRLAKDDKNLFFSPYSISNALAMTYAGARGATAQEMKKTLHFDLPEAEFHKSFANLVRDLQVPKENRKFTLRIANRLWGQQNYGFRPEFLKLTEDEYDAGLKEVNFKTNAEGARQEINQWVEKQTNDKITNLIPKGVLDNLTRLVLTNAIYFKAAWQSPFRPENTKKGEFLTASGEKVTAPMMSQTGLRTRFFENKDVKVLELPYEDRSASMYVILPTSKNSLSGLEKKLDIETLNEWMSGASTHLVNVKLPKFKMTAEFQLNDVLKEMGMPLAFDSKRADFSGIATQEHLYISAVLHKAFVDVNEAGTEAAASTAVVIATRSLPPRGVFHADHPFMFVIRDNSTGSLLFVGRVNNPVK